MPHSGGLCGGLAGWLRGGGRSEAIVIIGAAGAAAAFQEVVPNRMRGQVSAVYLFWSNLAGIGLGSTASPRHLLILSNQHPVSAEARYARPAAPRQRRLRPDLKQ